MNEPIRPREPWEENANAALDRVTAERDQLRAHSTVLEKMLAETRRALERVSMDRERLLGHRLTLLNALEERAHAMQQAGHIDGARALMALVREVADG
jgi:hypothetical protein